MSDLGSQDSVEHIYTERNEAVATLVKLAMRLGYPCWCDTKQDVEWPIVFVQLPYNGQVSWHIPVQEFIEYFPPSLPERGARWDGHTNEEKSMRLRREAAIDTAF